MLEWAHPPLISSKQNTFSCKIWPGSWEKYELSCDTKISKSLKKKVEEIGLGSFKRKQSASLHRHQHPNTRKYGVVKQNLVDPRCKDHGSILYSCCSTILGSPEIQVIENMKMGYRSEVDFADWDKRPSHPCSDAALIFSGVIFWASQILVHFAYLLFLFGIHEF